MFPVSPTGKMVGLSISPIFENGSPVRAIVASWPIVIAVIRPIAQRPVEGRAGIPWRSRIVSRRKRISVRRPMGASVSITGITPAMVRLR
jgi:hypothetical protein